MKVRNARKVRSVIMEIAKITSKGQITIPVEIRKNLNLASGDKVAFLEKDGEYVMVNVSRIGIKNNPKTVNVEGIIASMEFEDMHVNPEMKKYAEERIANRTTYETQIKKIKQRYGVK